MILLLGNIFSLIGTMFMIHSIYQKKEKYIAKWQIFYALFSSIANFILGGISGGITNAISTIRNVLIYYDKMTSELILILLLILIGLCLYFNNSSYIGIIPILASAQYGLILCLSEDHKTIKKSLLINTILWGIYDFYILAIPSLIMNIIIVFSIINSLRKKQHN